MSTLTDRFWDRMAASHARHERQLRARRGMGRITDVMELAHHEAFLWRRMDAELREGGDPTALEGGFAGLEVKPTLVAGSTITLGATELLLWPTGSNAPIPINPSMPKVYSFMGFGNATTAATPGTFTINPRFGTLITSPSGGVSSAITPLASVTAGQWHLRGEVILRTGGTATVADSSFLFAMSSGATGSGGPFSATASNAVFGGVSATFDSTAASALSFGLIATTSTTNTMIPQGSVWASWN